MSGWTAQDLPDLSGRTFVVTGANSGIGLSTATGLAGHGAHVVLACRNVAKAEQVRSSIVGSSEVRELDLADLGSVRRFADGLGSVDVLINNAGIMAVPRARTADGFEAQFGTNHLGHFALTGLLLPRITDRVVTLSSLLHRNGRIDLDDPNWERRRYRRWAAYGQSKLANLVFAYELARRLSAQDSPVRSLAAHPGITATGLQSHTGSWLQSAVLWVGNAALAQSAGMGALPTLYAATQDLPSSTYVGPGGFNELRGYPGAVGSSRAARDERTGTQLWSLSEELTGVRYLD